MGFWTFLDRNMPEILAALLIVCGAALLGAGACSGSDAREGCGVRIQKGCGVRIQIGSPADGGAP